MVLLVSIILHTSGTPMQATISIIFFFFNDTATTEIYTLSLHDALPIWHVDALAQLLVFAGLLELGDIGRRIRATAPGRSEEHTSELQSHSDLVCRLLLEKKNIASTAQQARRISGGLSAGPKGILRLCCS